MTGPNTKPAPRAPRVFDASDPAVKTEPVIELAPLEEDPDTAAPASRRIAGAASRQGLRWGALLLSALAGLTALAAGVAFTRFISAALERQDWIGWTAFSLILIAGFAALALAVREVFGLFRLRRLEALRATVTRALQTRDTALERTAVRNLEHLLGERADCRWGLSRMREHSGDVRDPGDLLRLADREVMVPLDTAARRLVLQSAKRVATVTALSPMAWIAMIFVLVENLRMLRGLAGLYGGRPGTAGTLRLGRLVVGHIIATGGLAMTDDLLGQFLGQDMLRRLSRRLGEGVFNGALTARLGVAALHVIRPLPFLDAEEIRVRDLVPEIFRRVPAAAKNA